MKRSQQRFLTTHTGSLPRPPELLELIYAREQGQPVDAAALEQQLDKAVADVVARQMEAGIDVVDDGELSKIGFNAYAKDRLSGLGRSGPRGASPSGDHVGLHGGPLDRREHPDYVTVASGGARLVEFPACDGPIGYRGEFAVAEDLRRFRRVVDLARPVDAFVTAVSPGTLTTIFGEGYYPGYEAFVFAVAEAMRVEYQAIVQAGFTLQLDAPDLAMERHMKFAAGTEEDFVRVVELHVAALNRAIEGLPVEQVRLHVCWGNYPGPHTYDVPLEKILAALLGAHVGALSIEASNPRHEHEWHLFEQVKLPPDLILIPGVIDSCTNYVEHPELVAERIIRLARLVGRENLIAGTDCGFGTFAGRELVAPTVAWRKLRSLAEGAALASRALW
ncbi:MAG: cobalamin-independent methionine synthase II family protein [Chloroflexota bacterium]